jgi:hypothetical protein
MLQNELSFASRHARVAEIAPARIGAFCDNGRKVEIAHYRKSASRDAGGDPRDASLPRDKL